MDNTAATERVGISFVANVSTNHNPSPYQLPVSGCTWKYNATISMLNGTPTRVGNAGAYVLTGNPTQSSSCAGGASTYLRFGLTEVPAGLKVRTWLWLPNDNGSLSSLPWGLKRYVAEQSFVLVVVNNTNPALAYQSDAVPLPWGGSTPGLTFTPGLSEILVPRSQFINSSIGAAISNRSLPNGSKIFGPLLGAIQGGAVVNSSHAGTLANLACYWQNRAVSSTPPLCSSSFHGTVANQTGTLLVLNASGWSSSNAGGLPSSPNVDQGNLATPAIDDVLTLNVSHSLAGNQTQQLDALLAGLLDNVTGGVNGTLLDATTRLLSLGLVPGVIAALANAVYPGAGNFGVPISHAVQQNPSGHGLLAFCWNVPACVVFISGQWLGLAFSNPFAAGLFLILLTFAMLTALQMNVASRVASGLATVGHLIAQSLSSLFSFIAAAAKALLTAAFQPIDAMMASSATSTKGTLDYAQTLHNQGLSSSGLGGRFFAGLNPIFDVFMVVSVVVVVILGLVQNLMLGAGFVLVLVVSLIIQLAVAYNVGNIDPAISGIQVATVWAFDGLVNCTTQTPHKVGFLCVGGNSVQNTSQWMYDVGAEIASKPQSGFFVTMVGLALTGATGTFGVTDAVGLATGLLGLYLTWWASQNGNPLEVLFVSMLNDFISVVCDVKSLLSPSSELNRGVTAVSGGIDAASFGLDLSRW